MCLARCARLCKSNRSQVQNAWSSGWTYRCHLDHQCRHWSNLQAALQKKRKQSGSRLESTFCSTGKEQVKLSAEASRPAADSFDASGSAGGRAFPEDVRWLPSGRFRFKWQRASKCEWLELASFMDFLFRLKQPRPHGDFVGTLCCKGSLFLELVSSTEFQAEVWNTQGSELGTRRNLVEFAVWA